MLQLVAEGEEVLGGLSAKTLPVRLQDGILEFEDAECRHNHVAVVVCAVVPPELGSALQTPGVEMDVNPFPAEMVP